jgi:hypothetical protein
MYLYILSIISNRQVVVIRSCNKLSIKNVDTKPSIGAQVLLAPQREREPLEGSNAKKEEIMKKGRKGHEGDKSRVCWF